MSEEWRDIPGFPGYQASTLGRVRSLDRVISSLNRYGHVSDKKLKGRVLSLGKCTNGYLGVLLGKGNQHRVHRLVAVTFIEGDTSLQINHKNGDRADNRADNLEWVTCSENHLHSYRELPRKKHELTRRVRIIKADQALEFESAVEASKYLGVVPGSVASAARREHRCKGFYVYYV